MSLNGPEGSGGVYIDFSDVDEKCMKCITPRVSNVAKVWSDVVRTRHKKDRLPKVDVHCNLKDADCRFSLSCPTVPGENYVFRNTRKCPYAEGASTEE